MYLPITKLAATDAVLLWCEEHTITHANALLTPAQARVASHIQIVDEVTAKLYLGEEDKPPPPSLLAFFNSDMEEEVSNKSVEASASSRERALAVSFLRRFCCTLVSVTSR